MWITNVDDTKNVTKWWSIFDCNLNINHKNAKNINAHLK